MSNYSIEKEENYNNNFLNEEKNKEKKIINDNDEPYQVKYDRVVQKVKRVSLEEIIKFSKLNYENQTYKFFKDNNLKNQKLFIVKKINKKEENPIVLSNKNYNKKLILKKKNKNNDYTYCIKSVNPKKINKQKIIKKEKKEEIIELKEEEDENEIEEAKNIIISENYNPKFYKILNK